jgi:hypothetical protein
MMNIPSNAPCQDQHFANLAFSAAIRIGNARDMNAEDIFYNLPHFGGTGSMWQLQTPSDNFADLSKADLEKVSADGFEYDGEYYAFIYQD